jgi:hypothetical protein
MQSLLGESYTKRAVPSSTEGDLPEWARKIVAWLGIEFGNVQRGMSQATSRTITTSTTLTVNDGLVLVDATSGSISATLPSPSAAQNTAITIKRIDASVNTVTIVGTIDGAVNPTLAQWKAKTVWAYAPAGKVGVWYSTAVV